MYADQKEATAAKVEMWLVLKLGQYLKLNYAKLVVLYVSFSIFWQYIAELYQVYLGRIRGAKGARCAKTRPFVSPLAGGAQALSHFKLLLFCPEA